MTWTTFHHRGEVLRAVTRGRRRAPRRHPADGRDRGPRDLRRRAHPARRPPAALAHPAVGAHRARAARPARPTSSGPSSPPGTPPPTSCPGTRLVLDHYRAEPLDDAMATALATSAAKERVLLAAMAGRAGARTEDTVAAGLDARGARAGDLPADHRSARAAPRCSTGSGPRRLTLPSPTVFRRPRSGRHAGAMTEIRAGMLLLASPELLDPNFADTVVLLLDADEDGAMGVVLNRPSPVPVVVGARRLGRHRGRARGAVPRRAGVARGCAGGGPACATATTCPVGLRPVTDRLALVDLDAR